MNNQNADRFLFGQLNSNYLSPYDWIELENVKSSYPDDNKGTKQFPFRVGDANISEAEKEENDSNLEIIDSVYSTINQYLKVFDKKVLKNDGKHPTDTDHKTLSGMMDNFRTNVEQLMSLLNGNRYPLLALIGRRGCGKSSCINAIVGQLIAEPGHIKAQTGHAKILLYRSHDNSGIDVLDTRGINEGERPQEDDIAETAVDSIVSALSQVPVDCIMYLHKSKELDSGIESDLKILNEIIVRTNLNSIKIPIIGVITHCDELEPSDIKKPSEYDEEKLENIEIAKNFFRDQLEKYAPDLNDCIVGVEAISSSVIWNKVPDENGAYLPKRDYRYNIDKIMDLLMNNVSMQAMFKTAQVCRVQLIKINFANTLIKLFASVTAVISTLPVPAADSVPLSALEVWMVYTIAKLGNNKLSWDSTRKFLGMLGVSGIARYCARKVISSFSKLFPIVGYGTSAAITYSITLALGKSAIAFFLEHKSDEEVKEIFNAAKLAIDDYECLSMDERVEMDQKFVDGMKEVSRRDNIDKNKASSSNSSS